MSGESVVEELLSWGGVPRTAQSACAYRWRNEPLPARGPGGLLPRGLGRSYGDVCLNSGGTLLTTRGLDRWIAWDEEAGILRCEAGASLDDILQFAVPRGWFLPVTPGTRFVTVGGAIANDVHGKNHHRAGTFGCHVARFELRRSDGSVRVCSPDEHPEMFGAAIGGLGLTGLITWADIRLKPIESPFVEMEAVPFHGLEEFAALSRGGGEAFEYTVGWLDCTSRGRNFCRGIFFRGNHASSEQASGLGRSRRATLVMPVSAPRWVLSRWSVGAFNELYFRRQAARRGPRIVDYEPFFYPLDAVRRWNRIYGRRGFFQFQAVVPNEAGLAPLESAMRRVVESGRASFLAVVKDFGSVRSPGWLSFPRPGITVCLDFPNDGAVTTALLGELEASVLGAGGALYAAKDAVMLPASFRAAYPRWQEFSRMIDPQFQSDLWRRVSIAPEKNEGV